MRTSGKFAVGGIVAWIAIIIFCVGCYVGNVVRLVQCDWSPSGSWKGEVIHTIGLIGPAAVITVWFDDK